MSVRIQFIDSHTEGEPTRVVLNGGPSLSGSLGSCVQKLAADYDSFRRSVILEPRGSDAMVGALLRPASQPECAAGVIFFNNEGYLGMCGHGAIGVAVTLHEMGRIGVGVHRLETPVGIVQVELLSSNEVVIQNVPSYRYRKQVKVEVQGLGVVIGDIAWGGNWFFLVNTCPIEIRACNLEALRDAALRVRDALRREGITGRDEQEIDHIEFFGPPMLKDAHSKNYVLCPGGAYDRSPCGTGTSAKLACLAADGKLGPGEAWIQESIVGSRFEASYQWLDDQNILPTIRGRAYLCAAGELIMEPQDPFNMGISNIQ